MQDDWYKDARESWGEYGELIMEFVSMLLAYTQRLVMLEYQKPEPDWDVVVRRFEAVFDCSVRGFTERFGQIAGTD